MYSSFTIFISVVFPKFLRLFLSTKCGLSFADPEGVAYFTEIINKFTKERPLSENVSDELKLIRPIDLCHFGNTIF